MDNRVTNAPRVTTNTPANNLAATRNAAPANNVAAVNTLDAAAFSSRPGAPADLAELQAVIAELEDRLATLEARVAELQGEDPAAPANLGPANVAANNAPAANGIQLPDGVNLPAFESVVPQADAATDDLPAANDLAVGDDLADLPASNVATQEAAAANQTLQGFMPGATPEKLAGLRAVEHVLAGAKLNGLTPDQEKIVERGLKRVHEIGRKIGNGEDPGKYAAELFALKHTLADPAGAGKHATVTLGAQTIAYIEDEKGKLAKGIAAAEKKLAKKADPVLQRQLADAVGRYKALVGIEKAIDGAKLTGLTKEQEAAARTQIDRLGVIAENVVGGTADPARVEAEVYKLAQGLKAPGKPAAEPASAVVNAGADVVARIADGKAAIQARLRDIDDQIIGGAAPEAYAAERARLLSNAEALEDLGDAVKAAKVDQGTSKERREVSFGLAKAAAMADAIAKGGDATSLRDDLFVLRQTFQEPVASKTNPAIQSGAAALAIIGEAEARNMAAREAIAAGAAKGRDMRAKDPQAAALARQAEDFEAMRRAIETADFGGLTPEQEARGAQLIDAMRAVAQKVAAGDDFGHHRARYEELAGQLAGLRNWRGGQAPAPAPQPIPPRPTAPAPASTDDDPVPAPAPVTPADTGPKPGKKYTVQKGDYLTKIAREQLGDPNRFAEIIALNQDKYPSLKTNPDLIYAGWELTLPAGGAKPAEVPAPKPTKPKPTAPKPTKPKPTTPTSPPTPASTGTSDQQAVAWLRANLDAQGRISREKIESMPKGPGRDALLAHFDTLLFGFIDPGRDGWTQLHRGDVERIEKALEVGGSIKGLAGQLTRQVLVDRQVGDRNGDFKLDEADVKLYAQELRGGAAPKPASNDPTPAPKPNDDGDAARLRRDLDAYLANPGNKDADAVLHILRTAPSYAVAATAEQKGRLIKQVLDGSANGEERRAALTILRMADERKETSAVLKAMDRKAVGDLLSDLGDETEGKEAAKLLLKAGAYADEHVWKAMDDDAVSGLLKALGFKEPMIGTNDQLRALPEAAKHHMIKELLGGNLTWGELAQAEWLNQHTEIPYRIPDYRNR